MDGRRVQSVGGGVRIMLAVPENEIARMPDHELRMTFFSDPDRNLLGLMSEVRD